MPTKNQLTTIVLLAALIWGVSLTLQGVALAPSWIKPLTTVVGVLMAILSAFNLWLWKWPVFRGWLVRRPVVAGTWKAVLRSTWRDPATGQVSAPIDGFMVIRQTYSGLSMRLLTPESSSVLLSAEITRTEDGLFSISGVYRNEPLMAVRDRSRMHHGGLLLEVIGNPPSALQGKYWTDRDSAGDLELTDHRAATFQDFASAAGRKSGST